MVTYSHMFITLVILYILSANFQAQGATESVATDNSVRDRKTIVQGTYLPQRTVSRRCTPCRGCAKNTCCYEFICNDPTNPGLTCVGTMLYCDCNIETCNSNF
ncbi:hypothetical protein ACQJBY_014845 [Aegilops geniculata]